MKKMFSKIKNKLLTLKRHLYLKLNNIRLSFRFSKVNGKIRIYIHEKHQRKIKSIKWILPLIGLIISLFTLPVLYAFLVALSLYLFSSLIARIFFFFTSLFVHLLPDFEINNDLWLGMSFGYYEPTDKKFQIPLVGLVFSDEEYAKKFFSLLQKWNYDSLTDKDNNFVMSIILDNDDGYYTCIYPNISRRSAEMFVQEVESRRKKTFPEEQHIKLFAHIFTMKRFIVTSKSYFPTFRKRYDDGVPYRLEAMIGTEENIDKFEKIKDIPGFTKFNLKIKERKDLNREDIEYDLLRLFRD